MKQENGTLRAETQKFAMKYIDMVQGVVAFSLQHGDTPGIRIYRSTISMLPHDCCNGIQFIFFSISSTIYYGHVQ